MSDSQTSPLPIFNSQNTFVNEPETMSSAIASEDEDEDHPALPHHPPHEPGPDPELEAAALNLRRTELLALTFCVLSPIIGGYLLHYIREFLSRPSEGVVSTFNITLFVMAAELRPALKLMEMIKQRSLYLQKVVHRDMLEGAMAVKEIPQVDLGPLLGRLEGLEGTIEELRMAVARVQGGREEVVTGVREGIRSDVEALNRTFPVTALFRVQLLIRVGAVRRYEKNFALHRAHTEDRINLLSSRVNDISLIVSDTSHPHGLLHVILSLPDTLLHLVHSILSLPKIFLIKVLRVFFRKKTERPTGIARSKSSGSLKGTKSPSKRRVAASRSD